ncbi:Sec-independent protein translocase subunit TatA [Actinomadura parmotrematis]|uniref:Sec-independent protein translocase protein TatA n=1 Tax=Actinomadura parmotrematis TaxID=2864039 RepID=A0ABS7FSQ2_9ACTN|nr:Sec-independent protein translocase subunit TatA [Actinomadura parmotrematis]MBW8483412.1 Sec-independent protein translocase subunit TatA [Actinomadura parmotrematis]
MLSSIGTPELLILLVVILLIFGSAKLPQLARSLGKSARILKAETKGLRDDDDDAPEQHADRKAAAAGPEAARDRAAALREEAARLEHEANVQQGYAPAPRTLPSGEPIQGVPVDPANLRKS